MTSSNGNISALLAICTGHSPFPGEFHAQRPVTRSYDVFFDQHPNKRLSKQWWGCWFKTPSCTLWRHRNVVTVQGDTILQGTCLPIILMVHLTSYCMTVRRRFYVIFVPWYWCVLLGCTCFPLPALITLVWIRTRWLGTLSLNSGRRS